MKKQIELMLMGVNNIGQKLTHLEKKSTRYSESTLEEIKKKNENPQYKNAVAMFKMGASVEEVMNACQINSRSEAELMKKLYSPHKEVVKNSKEIVF